ncbi:MAG: hypothetical protein JWM10_3926, partial [Myxococcaceae bacterium]|nr:hypothetical protein [Myxococcaceae bacterium]
APATAAGAWRLALGWPVTSTTFAVGPTGAVTGTMVDTYGSATLQGALDLADGTITFVKRYTSGDSVGQQYLYTGTVNAAGTAITAGRWSDQGASGLAGSWTAAR